MFQRPVLVQFVVLLSFAVFLGTAVLFWSTPSVAVQDRTVGLDFEELEKKTKSGSLSPGSVSSIKVVHSVDYSGLVVDNAWNAIEKTTVEELQNLSLSSKPSLSPLPTFSESVTNSGNEEAIEWCFSLELIISKKPKSKFVFVELGGGYGRWTFRAG